MYNYYLYLFKIYETVCIVFLVGMNANFIIGVLHNSITGNILFNMT